MQFNNSFGCLFTLFLFFVIFLGATRLLFTTPLGLILLGYLIYRMYKSNYKIKQNSTTYTEHVFEEEEESDNNNNFFENDDVIDIEYEEIDD